MECMDRFIEAHAALRSLTKIEDRHIQSGDYGTKAIAV